MRRVADTLVLRAAVMRAVRDFFASRDYIEVTTPIWVAAPALENHIDAVAVGDGYLRTSPEFHMKRLLAAGIERPWQLGPCFRAGEKGRQHNPEFWMLEWYRAHADYETLLIETRDLLVNIARSVLGSTCLTGPHGKLDLALPWARLTVAEAFEQHAGWNPVADWDEDRFTLDLVEKVEPALPDDRPAVLVDYPVAEAALARVRSDQPPVAERWELYIGGVELANAFSELTDPVEQRCRFMACARTRAARGAVVYPLDTLFLNALEAGMPPSAGVALGFDRLLMLLAGAGHIADISPFVEAIE